MQRPRGGRPTRPQQPLGMQPVRPKLRKKKRREVRWNWENLRWSRLNTEQRVALVAIVVSVLFFIGIVVRQVDVYQTQKRKVALEQQVQELQEKNAKLEEEKAQLQQPAHIEKVAREELGLVKPGEVPYVH